MSARVWRAALLVSAANLACAAASAPWQPATPPVAEADGYVLIRGGTFLEGDVARGGGRMQRVEDFALAVRPVTNAEYADFVRETRHAAPEHWGAAEPPAAWAALPVIFVNRYDAAAFAAWKTRRTGIVHRLPTIAEFEYAARGGRERAAYPWGDDAPDGRANFDRDGTRDFAAWRDYLEPVANRPANAYGLRDLAGNVWHWVDSAEDPVRDTYKYRIAVPEDMERVVLGGSWARGAAYLRCGNQGRMSPGLRQPDVGFRLAREPFPGAPGFRAQTRRLLALPRGDAGVFVGWQLLPGDRSDTRFNVYRTAQRYAPGERLNAFPLTGGTGFLDRTAPSGALRYYRVRPVDAAGREGPSSEWVGTVAGPRASGVVASFVPLPREGSLVPVFGDLDGDGLLDAVLRFGRGHAETAPDPGVPVEIEAYAHGGRFLWRQPLAGHRVSLGNANNVPVVVHDLDGDGRAEVACRYEEGGAAFLAVFDGRTGELRGKTPWPPLLTDHARSSSRILLAVGYLDGRTPALVAQTGLYENEILTAYGGDLRPLWEYRSTGATGGSGSHRLEIADVDGDGRDEVIAGSLCLNGDGSLRWCLYRQHADHVIVRDFLPARPGREIFFAVETATHAGIYLAEAATGKIIWQRTREAEPAWRHAHSAWVADISSLHPGPECYASRDRGGGHALWSPHGDLLVEPFPGDVYTPLEWDGRPGRELLHKTTLAPGRFDGTRFVPLAGELHPDGVAGRVAMVADLAGDFRDEIVVVGEREGKRGVFVLGAGSPVSEREVARTSDREYRLWLARNLGGGYGSYFEASILSPP